jgi:hypothetical protein
MTCDRDQGEEGKAIGVRLRAQGRRMVLIGLKIQITSTKLQINSKFQSLDGDFDPNEENTIAASSCFGNWSLDIVCCLEFGIWSSSLPVDSFLAVFRTPYAVNRFQRLKPPLDFVLLLLTLSLTLAFLLCSCCH